MEYITLILSLISISMTVIGFLLVKKGESMGLYISLMAIVVAITALGIALNL